MLLFRLIGTAVMSAMGTKQLYIHRELVGFFVYFAVFQFVYVPMVLLKAYFHLLSYGWLLAIIIMILVCGVYLVSCGGKIPFAMPEKNSENNILKWLMVLVSAGFLVFLVLQQYLGWDTAFYMGNMNEAIYTDTMYLYNGNDGTMMNKMDLRYALSGFSMQFAIPCFLLDISPVIMCYYGIRGLGAILTLLIVFDFGMLLFDRDATASYLTVGAFIIVNTLFFSHSATSLFFIRRMYEAKGYCANIVMPMVALLLLMIYKKQGRHLWMLLFVICLGSVGASMSSMMLVPTLLGLGSVLIAIEERRIRPVVYGVVCALPNLLYVALFILNKMGIFVIEI